MSESTLYDLVIIGAGPAGISAAIYASRALLTTVVLEQTSPGGQVLLTSEVYNYPGVPSTSGYELIQAMENQAKDLGVTIHSAQVSSISSTCDNNFIISCNGGTSYNAKAVILASGSTPRKAGFEGEEDFIGRGISYCATCDGMFYRNKPVYVVGGGNSAAEEALFLTRFASEVHMIIRKDHLRAQAALVDQLQQNEKVFVHFRTTISKVEGEDLLTKLYLHNEDTDEITCISGDPGSFGVFVFVGQLPSSELIKEFAELDQTGAVITDEYMATRTPGLYCAGDVRSKVLRQIITAASDGAVAATSVAGYLGQPIAG